MNAEFNRFYLVQYPIVPAGMPCEEADWKKTGGDFEMAPVA